MLCSQMIANENPAWTAPLDFRFPLFFDSPPTGNHNSPVFCDLGTLFPLLSHKIARNSSRIKRLRTLAKTTEAYRAKRASHISSSTFDFDVRALFSTACRFSPRVRRSTIDDQLVLSPLESVFRQNAFVSRVESAFTFPIGVGIPRSPQSPNGTRTLAKTSMIQRKTQSKIQRQRTQRKSS